jgi:flagellar secretion chaperone FliS
MSYASGRATQAYASVSVQTKVAAASPHRLIQMLMDGALDRLAIAKGQIARNEVPQKANTLTRVMSIIDGLRLALDHDVNPELTGNLESLYDYMNRRLLIANINNDCEVIDEVAALLRELKEAWDAIPQHLGEEAAQGSMPHTAVANG